MSEKTIVQCLTDVMRDVKAVKKEGFNNFGHYNFRGIDDVLNAVGPVFQKHGVVPKPEVTDYRREAVKTTDGKVMTSVVLRMNVHFTGPANDVLTATVWGEAFDCGDKATTKAHSVALRTAILQTLCLPTQEPDPDEFSYQIGASSGVSDELEKAAEACTTIEELRQLYKRAANDDERLFLSEYAHKLQVEP